MYIIDSIDDYTTLELSPQGDYVCVYPDPDGGWTSSPVFLLPGGRPNIKHERPFARRAQMFI